MKFHNNVEGGHINIESLYRFRKFVIAPARNELSPKHILSLFVLQVAIYKFILQCKVPLLTN
jgi:hypothetical protein